MSVVPAAAFRSLPLPNTASASRQDVIDYFNNCWTLTEVLFACLQGNEAFYRQPYHQLRHPMVSLALLIGVPGSPVCHAL